MVSLHGCGGHNDLQEISDSFTLNHPIFYGSAFLNGKLKKNKSLLLELIYHQDGVLLNVSTVFFPAAVLPAVFTKPDLIVFTWCVMQLAHSAS